MFDAGAIEARLTVKLDQFDRDLDRAEARVREFERKRHEIRISAVFDQAAFGRARTMFAQLDNQLSRDAANRLRSSPQGSVLGALNALFSPHQITGGPTALQSGTQGALGKIVNQPVSRTTRVKDTTVLDSVLQVDKASATAKGAEAVKDAEAGANAEAARAGGGFWRRFFSFRRGSGGGGSSGGGVDAGGFAKNLGGGIGPGILGLNPKLASILGLGGALAGGLPALLAAGGALGVGGAGIGALVLGAKQLIGTKNQQGQPATQGPLFNQAQVVGKSLQSTLQGAAGALTKPLEQAFGAIPRLLKGIQPALTSVFAGAGTLINPLLHGIADLAHMVLPALGTAFRAVAPLMRPLIDGLGKLVAGILPGLTALLRVASPAIKALSSGLGAIGGDLGKLFAGFVPVIKQSALIFKDLLDVVGGLFPILGKIVAILASAMAPVFTQLTTIIKALLPVIEIIGNVFASLAGALLGDLVSAFGALAQLIKAISPALKVFAQAISDVFNVLENTGVFAILGDALEAIVGPLGKVISALLRGLIPVIKPLIGFVGQLSGLIASQLAAAIVELLPPLTQLALVVLQALAQILPVVLPLITDFAKIFTGAVVFAARDLAVALTAIISAIPPTALKFIVDGILAIVAAIKAWAIVQAVINILLDANPIGLIVIGIAALTVGIVELVKHWGAVWGFIKRITGDVWHFLDGIFHDIGHWFTVAFVDSLHALQKAWDVSWGFVKRIVGDAVGFIRQHFYLILAFLGPVGLLAAGAIEFALHWRAILKDVARAGSDAWSWLESHFFQPLHNGIFDVIHFFEQLPGRIISALSGLASDLYNVAKNAIGGLISGFENNIPGGGVIGGLVKKGLNLIGLAKGGMLMEPVVGFGTRTGTVYTLAEHEPEYVVPTSGSGGDALRGGGNISQLANNIYIMQPEGLTLAQAFNELHYQLEVSKMQGYVGARP